MAAIALSIESLRSLKNVLQDRFPTIKSSHMSEALASALGFRTHAALLTQAAAGITNPLYPLNESRFIERLHQLRYPGIQAFSFDDLINGRGVPEEFRTLIQRLLKLEERPDGRRDEIYLLHQRCASLFGKAFDIGYPESREDDDKKMVKRLHRGVDHKACEPGWGDIVNTRHTYIEFPGSDHQKHFHERLPLSNGRYVEYTTAVVSMPYSDSTNIPQLQKARVLAERIGWECVVLKEWTWYAAAATTLVLFRRRSTHEDILRAWAASFKRWLFENKSRLLKGASADRRHVISDAIDCQHLPLDVDTWEDFRERYLKEFAFDLYADERNPMAKALKKIFEKWCAERPDTVEPISPM